MVRSNIGVTSIYAVKALTFTGNYHMQKPDRCQAFLVNKYKMERDRIGFPHFTTFTSTTDI
ncbi:hypothetical protein DL897_04040 [Thermoflavimicrobium daqui]|uniref:Uncharacterized protein n=1 Tax=Thermoflavimicrobium daqui TaxID=2137476 RepID=A0A364K7A4_9BACL|nr:hypothetical protein DL897_04040 [Thermoflavimicrobium daqui]